jgi:hypothetical protein
MASVGSKLLNAGVLASLAGHDFLLEFSRRKPHNEGWTFSGGFHPLLIAPPPVDADGGASYLAHLLGGPLNLDHPLSFRPVSDYTGRFAFTANSRSLSCGLNLNFEHLVGSPRKAS